MGLTHYFDDTPFHAISVSYGPPATWEFIANNVPEGIATGDVMVMIIFSGSTDPWGMASAPSDWTLQYSESFIEDSIYYNFFIYTKVWGSGDDPTTYTATWTDDGTNLVVDASMVNHAVGAPGGVGAVGGHALYLGSSAPGSFAYPGSSTEFEFLSGASFFSGFVPTSPVDLAWITIGGDAIYFAATYDPDVGGSYTPPFRFDFTGTDLEPIRTSNVGTGGLRVYAVWQLSPAPPAEDIRISRNVMHVRTLAVS